MSYRKQQVMGLTSMTSDCVLYSINRDYRLKLQLSIDNEVLVEKTGLSNKAHIRA